MFAGNYNRSFLQGFQPPLPPPLPPYPPSPPPPPPPSPPLSDIENSPSQDHPAEYQSESFNTALHQLNQEPQVCLPRPPPAGPAAVFAPPPNRMFRGRGNWRQYHQNYFSHERAGGRPYRRRRSHLDDIYLPNYEDNDDVNETEDASQHQRFQNRRNRWDIRQTSPNMPHKKEIRQRCLVSTDSHASTSKVCVDEAKAKDAQPAKLEPAIKLASDKFPLTDCETKKFNKNCNEEKDKTVSKQIKAKNEETNIKPNTNDTLVKRANVEDNSTVTKCHGLQNKSNDQDCTSSTNLKAAALDNTFESISSNESILATSDDRSAEETTLKGTSVDVNICHTLPAAFPTWQPLEMESKYRNLYTSVKEIDSDQETVCFDDITVDKIDTTKSYLMNLGPELDDYRVVDMVISTPSPPKRPAKGSNMDAMTKKTKYDDINSDELLSEIEEILRGDKHSGDSTTPKCARRYRSKSLGTDTGEKSTLRRSISLNSLEKSNSQIMYNFDLKTNLLLLLGDQTLTRGSEGDTKKKVEKQEEQEIKPVKDEATASVCDQNVKSNETKTSESESDMISDATASAVNVSAENMPKDAVSLKDLKENESINYTNLKITKPYSSPRHSDKDKRVDEGRKKERRGSDETKRTQGQVRTHKIDDNQADRVDSCKKASEPCSAVRYSDYKKSVDLSKNSPPPEMNLCAIMANPKKITCRRKTFSNENELHLQKMHKLFGSDSDIEDLESGGEKSRKRKDDRDHGSSRKEPPAKRLSVESKLPKPKNLDNTRRYSTSGCSVSEHSRASPKLVINEKQCSQKVHSATIDKSSQHNSTSKKVLDPSTSTPTKSVDYSKKNKRRIEMPLSSDKNGDANNKSNRNSLGKASEKTDKRASGGGSPKSELRTQYTEKSKDGRCINVGKTDEKQITHPTVVAGNTCKKDRSMEGNESPKLVDENNKNGTPKSAAKGELHVPLKNIRKDGKQSPPLVQQEIVASALSGINNPSQLVPNALELPASSSAIAVKKELPIKKAIETFALDSNYTKCLPLAKDRFPLMQKNRVSISENECSDRAVILERPDVREEIERVKQVVSVSAVANEKESDDVIEIRPDIPIIDLTDDHEVKLVDPPKAGAIVMPDKTEDVDLTLDTSTDGGITLYRSDETLNNSLEVQATVASISSNGYDQQPQEIKTDDQSASASAVINTTTAPQQLSETNARDVTLLLIEKAINEAISLQKQPSKPDKINTVQVSGTYKKQQSKPDKTNTVQVSGTYKPSVGVPEVNSYSNTSPTGPNVAISNGRNLMGPPPSSAQRNPSVQFPRRNDDNGGPNSVPQSPRRLEAADSQQFTLGFLLQSSRPENATNKAPVNAIAQSPRRIDSTREQTAVAQAESNSSPVIFNTLARNSNIADNLPIRIETNTRVDLTRGLAGAENGQSFFGVAQSPRRLETAFTQSPRADSLSEPSCYTAAMSTPRRRDSATSQIALNLDSPSSSREQNIAGQSPRQVNSCVDSPLRSLRQLVVPQGGGVFEISNREANAVGLLLVRYLYYFDGLKKAQMAYSEELKKLNRCLPNIVKTELVQFENINSSKFYVLSKDLIGDLKSLNITSTQHNFSKIQLIMNSVFKSIKVEVPNLTITWLYLMLEALMQPEMTQYMNVPFLTDMYTYVTYVTSKIHSHTVSMENAAAVQNSAPPQDLFTPDQRRLLERQLQQYKAICTNQVTLISMEKSLQSTLLRAHQNSHNARVNQQNISTTIEVDVQSRLRKTNGGTVQVQPSMDHWRRAESQNVQVSSSPPQIVNTIANAAPPIVSLPSDNPSASQQMNNISSVPPRHSDTLKNILISTSSPKKPSKRTSRAISQSSKQPSVGTSPVSNLTVHSNIVISPTSTNISMCSPRRNQSDIPGNALNTSGKNSRRNSSPSTFRFVPILPKPNTGTERTNENFRIRLPFTMPYDINSSPTAAATTTAAHMSPRLTMQHTGTSPSMPLLEDDSPVILPNLSHIQSVTRSPVYAPMAIIPPLVNSPSPPPEQPTAPVVEAAETQEEADEQEAMSSTSDQDTPEYKPPLVKSEVELQLKDKDIEIIDLTWLDDIDPEQLQNEIKCFGIKKEEPFEIEASEEGDVFQEGVNVAHSPADSGISSPSIQVEYNEQVFSDRTCICGKPAEYVCGCMMAMYCSEPCQLKDWKTHKETCLKHNAKGKEGAQNQ